VIGYPTNWALAHIDGAVNPSTEDEVRLFFSSPGPRTFSEIPVTEGMDVWPFFGSNTSNYTELVFDDGLDGRYAAVWHMNELVTANGELDRGRTGDTSGFFNTGTLAGGAAFPARNNGANGKAVELNGAGARVEVPNAASQSPVNQLTVEMSLRPDAPVDCDGGNNYRYIFGKGDFATGAYSLVIEDDMSFQARVLAGGEQRSLRSMATIPVGSWSHVAFTYDAASGRMSFFIDGVETSTETFSSGTLGGSRDPIRIGGPGDAPACPPTGHGSFRGAIDEVKISNVVRYGDIPPAPLPDGGPTDVDGGPTTGRDGGPVAGRDGGGIAPGSDGGGGGPGSDSGTGGPGGGGVSSGCSASGRGPIAPWALAVTAMSIAFAGRRKRRA
jgi:hypothetical protein